MKPLLSGRGRKGPSLEPGPPGPQTSGLQSWKSMKSYCFKELCLRSFVTAAQEIMHPTMRPHRFLMPLKQEVQVVGQITVNTPHPPHPQAHCTHTCRVLGNMASTQWLLPKWWSARCPVYEFLAFQENGIWVSTASLPAIIATIHSATDSTTSMECHFPWWEIVSTGKCQRSG